MPLSNLMALTQRNATGDPNYEWNANGGADIQGHEAERELQETDFVDDLEEELGNMVLEFACLQDLEEQERRFRQAIIQKRLGNTEMMLNKKFKTLTGAAYSVATRGQAMASSGKSQTGATAWFIYFIGSLAGLKERSKDFPILYHVMEVISAVCGAVFIFSYLGLIGWEIFTYHIKLDHLEGSSTTIPPDEVPSDRAILKVLKMGALLWILLASWYLRRFFVRLARDRVILNKTARYIKMQSPHHYTTFVLGGIFLVCQLVMLYEETVLNITEGDVDINWWAGPIIFSTRAVTEVLGVFHNILVHVFCHSWCEYVGKIAAGYRVQLEQDATVGEFNYFVTTYEKKKEDLKRWNKAWNFQVEDNEETDLNLDKIEVLDNDDLLVQHMHVKERLEVTSRRFQFWLFLNIFFVGMFVLDYLVRNLYVGTNLLELINFIIVLIWFGIFLSGVLRLNGQLANMSKHIYPLPSRGPVFGVMGAAPAQVLVYGGALTYSSITAIFVALALGTATRLIIKLPTQ